jgi:hypothetical protein
MAVRTVCCLWGGGRRPLWCSLCAYPAVATSWSWSLSNMSSFWSDGARVLRPSHVLTDEKVSLDIGHAIGVSPCRNERNVHVSGGRTLVSFVGCLATSWLNLELFATPSPSWSRAVPSLNPRHETVTELSDWDQPYVRVSWMITTLLTTLGKQPRIPAHSLRPYRPFVLQELGRLLIL